VTDPKHPEHSSDPGDPGDPDSLPVLTDVLVPGRPPMPRPAAQHEPDAATRSEPSMHESARSFATAEQQDARRPTESSTEAVRAAQMEAFVEPAAAAPSASAEPPADTPVEAPVEAPTEPSTAAQRQAELERRAKAEQDAAAQQQVEAAAPLSSAAPAVELPAAEDLSERDAEQLAERLRVRFAGYLREEGRAVIEARCRDALQEHTSWLVRQVTREVALALEGEVVGWVRDAVREELAAHRASRRPGAKSVPGVSR
jgi:Protein of unknown function (DUF2486)